MGLKVAQTNFSSGELDPKMSMRVDIGAYANGAKRLRNVRVLNQGGITRRPGTEYLATLPARCRLIPFEFSSNERYMLAFSNGRLDVYQLNGTLLQTITGMAWSDAILFDMTYAQAADTMIVCYETMRPQIIKRTSLTTFSVTGFAFDVSVNGNQVFQPYYKFAEDPVTLRASATTGSVTLTASTGVFRAGHVGDRFRWYDVEMQITAVGSTTSATATIYGTLEGRYAADPFKTTTGSTVVEVTHANHGIPSGTTLTISGANALGGISAANLNGARAITVTDDNHYTFVAGGAATESADGGGTNVKFSGANIPTRDWSEPAFSTVNGWPGAVTFHEGRLWFGGSYSQPDGLWGSKINQYYNFYVGEGLENESVQVTIGSDDISSIKHLVSNRHLQIFTATSEFYVPRTQQSTITSSSIQIARQTPYGCSSVTPMPFDGATVFLQATRKSVREFLYTDTEQAYNAPALTLLADHLVGAPTDMAVCYGSTKSGEQYLYLVNTDGTMAVFHSARSEKLAAWTLWETGSAALYGNFISVASIGERVYTVVQRGATYYLERFAESDLDLTLDSAEGYTNGSATTNWALGARFANKLVSVVSDNYYMGDFTADVSGNIVLSAPVTSITAGYNYIPVIETLPVHMVLQDGVYTGRPKRIARAILGLDSTLAVSIQNNRFILRQVRDDFSQMPDLFTGKAEFFLLGFQRDATVIVTQTEPLPLRLLGIAMEVSI